MVFDGFGKVFLNMLFLFVVFRIEQHLAFHDFLRELHFTDFVQAIVFNVNDKFKVAVLFVHRLHLRLDTGTELLLRPAAGRQIPVGDGMLELLDGRAEASGLWTGDGTLTGICIRCDLLAGVLERGGEHADDAAMAEALERDAAGWLSEAVRRAQELGCDFPMLGDAVRKSAPKGADTAAWDSLFPTLPVTIEVRAEIGRGYDLA